MKTCQALASSRFRILKLAFPALLAAVFLDLVCIPALGQNPQSLTNLVGNTIVLPGVEGPVGTTYQWLKDGAVLQDDLRITGSQTATLTIASADFTDSGTYTLIATFIVNGTSVTQTNSIFIVYVIAPPAIQNFFSETNSVSLFFEVDATGGLLSYQWFWQGQPIPGATNNILDFSSNFATANAGFYSVIITNPAGLVSSPPPGLCLRTCGLTNLVGGTIVLSGTQGPPGATNQWLKDGIPLTNDSRFSGSQTPTLTITSADLTNSGTYTLTAGFLSNGASVVQNNSIFVVYVLGQPAIQNFFSMMRGADVIFEADATGGLLSFQWFWQGQPIPGATNSTLVFPNGYTTASAGFYSLVITNPIGQVASVLPGLLFTKPTPSGIYQGLFFNTNALSVDSSGFFQYVLSASTRSFSGRIIIEKKAFPFSGTFSAAHDSQIIVPHTSLQLRLQLVATNNTAQVFGAISSDEWTSDLQGNLLFYSSKNLFPQPGRFTVSLQDTNIISPGRPNGAGFGLIRVVGSGVAAISGLAADNTPFAQSCGLSKNGDLPLYVPLYRGRGLLMGWLHVTGQANSSVQGDSIFWLKTAGPDKYYPDGFFETLRAQGSTYNPAATTPLLSFTQGVAAFGGGDLFSQNLVVWDFVRVNQPRTNVFTAEPSFERLSLSLNRANGMFTGRFVDIVTGLGAPIRAIVLQQQNSAPGFFLSTNTSGFFVLEQSQ